MAQPKFLDEEQVLNGIDRSALVDALESAFAGLATSKSVQPAQTVTVFPEGGGDCIFYPGLLWDSGLVGVKVSPYIAALKTRGEQPVTAYTFLFSTDTGQPRLVCDSLALTTARTAATTMLATRFLAPAAAETLLVVGAGKVAQEHVLYAADQRPWQKLLMWSPSLVDPASPQQQQRRSEVANLGIPVEIASDLTSAAAAADVVMLCTSSRTPVLDVSVLKSDVLVTSVGTSAPDAHEIDPDSLNDLAVFCDYRQTAPVSAGDMKLAIEAGTWSADEIVGDLPELAIGEAFRPAGGRVYFRSTGLGIEDLAAANLLM